MKFLMFWVPTFSEMKLTPATRATNLEEENKLIEADFEFIRYSEKDQARAIPPSIFLRHYWSPSFKELRDRTLKAPTELEQTIN